MSDTRPFTGSIPWMGGLQDRVHPMYVPDDGMSEAYDCDLLFDGSKVKRAGVRDMYGAIYTASSAYVANNPG